MSTTRRTAAERNLAFLAIVGNDRPDFRTISEFRKHHRDARRPLFIEVLRLAAELGMVKLGNLSTDGTKIEANASRHKAMSYGDMFKELARLEQEIDQLLARADRVDDEQDAALGNRRGGRLASTSWSRCLAKSNICAASASSCYGARNASQRNGNWSA
jgi:hypothetical protein